MTQFLFLESWIHFMGRQADCGGGEMALEFSFEGLYPRFTALRFRRDYRISGWFALSLPCVSFPLC